MTRSECASKYGAIDLERRRWPLESKHCIVIKIPEVVARAVKNSATGRPWERVYLNRDMAKPLLRAMNSVVDRGYLPELKTFDGCFNIRPVRGERVLLSAHCWALAIDFNALENPLGGPSKFSPGFISCFTAEGFVHGATFHREDPMHFSFAGF